MGVRAGAASRTSERYTSCLERIWFGSISEPSGLALLSRLPEAHIRSAMAARLGGSYDGS